MTNGSESVLAPGLSITPVDGMLIVKLGDQPRRVIWSSLMSSTGDASKLPLTPGAVREREEEVHAHPQLVETGSMRSAGMIFPLGNGIADPPVPGLLGSSRVVAGS